MNVIQSKLGHVLSMCSFIPLVLTLASLYLFFLCYSRHYEKITTPLSVRKAVHDFFLFAITSTGAVAFFCYKIFPEYFHQGNLVCMMLFLLWGYLYYLRWTSPFNLIVATEKLSQLSLYATILITVITIIACGYTFFLTLVQAKLYMDATLVTTITKGLESVPDLLEEPSHKADSTQVQLSQPKEEGGAF